MDDFGDVNDQSKEAFDVAKSILKALEKKRINTNIAQAALGTAWIAACEAHGFTKEAFRGMALELIDMFIEAPPYPGNCRDDLDHKMDRL